MYNADNSASVADDITFLMMGAILWTALLSWGTVELLEREKCPPARQYAFGLLRGSLHCCGWPVSCCLYCMQCKRLLVLLCNWRIAVFASMCLSLGLQIEKR